MRWHLKLDYVKEVEKWMGVDSMVAQSAKKDYEELPGAPEGFSGAEMELFHENMAYLLTWVASPDATQSA